MAGRRTLGEVIEEIADKLRDTLGALAPQPDAIPVPVRPDRRPDPRR